MTHIEVPVSDIGSYIRENKEEMITFMHMIAYNDDYGVEVFLSLEDGEADIATVTVTADGDIVFEDSVAIDKTLTDLEEMISGVYNDYLTDRVFEKVGAIDCEEDEYDAAAEREYELDDAVSDFLSVVYNEDGVKIEINEPLIKKFKEAALEYLARTHSKHIYRPMYLMATDGTEFFDSYPYECVTFTDNSK